MLDLCIPHFIFVWNCT